ncbi:MAG: porin [Thiotrichales bacterium]|nr:porin [Thiotrichales bacterium]
MLKKSNTIKKTAILLALAGALVSQSVQAANWLMIQGTEPADQAPRAKVWGFVQIDYQKTDDTKLKAGPGAGESAAFNQLAPQLDTSQGFNARRARLAIRGANFPLDNKVNYFLMAELGNNGITTGGKASQGQLTDASVTLNHIPGARVRLGLFKTPGSEEGLKAIPVFNYVNFTNVTDRLLLERTFDNSAGDTGRNGPVGAFRDTGVQVFDAFRKGEWEHSYALMVGNGGGLAMTDKDSDLDLYGYLSTEKIFGDSKGPRRHGMKFFAWMQDGKRTIDDTSGNTRKRSGLGSTYFDGKYRLAAEYIMANGMIYNGTTAARTPDNGGTFSVLKDQKSNGYYLDLGYRVKPNLELNVRYDRLNNATDANGDGGAAAERQFTTTTLGGQYFFNKKTSVRLNYEIRDAKAPNLDSTAAANVILSGLDNRVSAQVMMIF